ncbi:hypothetical protein BJ508DRAFT_331297 [Ascobolus immersus RN42]|uniref:Uncharacterized protein n=1 Tax=Ascobolus immersus RN42 TaxID=1160509 RepID=A0A3N4HSP8_ASCIM|nr:hypothetical protein BJ508DRAFT_331297 [Ascobolus immersus RN42]
MTKSNKCGGSQGGMGFFSPFYREEFVPYVRRRMVPGRGDSVARSKEVGLWESRGYTGTGQFGHSDYGSTRWIGYTGTGQFGHSDYGSTGWIGYTGTGQFGHSDYGSTGWIGYTGTGQFGHSGHGNTGWTGYTADCWTRTKAENEGKCHMYGSYWWYGPYGFPPSASLRP